MPSAPPSEKKHLNMKNKNAYRHLKNLFCHLHGCKIPPYMFKIISCLHTMVLCLIYDSVSWIRVHHLNWYFKVWSHASKNIFIYVCTYICIYVGLCRFTSGPKKLPIIAYYSTEFKCIFYVHHIMKIVNLVAAATLLSSYRNLFLWKILRNNFKTQRWRYCLEGAAHACQKGLCVVAPSIW